MDLLFQGNLAKVPKASNAMSRPEKRHVSGTPTENRQQLISPLRPDRDLVECRGPAWAGGWALLIGLIALMGVAISVWAGGLLPVAITEYLRLPDPPRQGPEAWQWAAIGCCGSITLFALGGLTRVRVGTAYALSLFGRYRGSVRRTGLVWISPLMLRRRVDVRLRHWRSEPITAVDAQGVELRVVVLVVWKVKDTARATFTVDDHSMYLREQVEAVTARVASQLPADPLREFADAMPTLRDFEVVGDTLTTRLAAECRAVGIEVFSARPTHVEYPPEVTAAVKRRQVAIIDARHRDSVLTSVLDAVDDTVRQLTERGLIELDDYERKALVKDLTVAFYTARGNAVDP
ncbi:SPFH domain-containing protein [Streptomyces kronopolitis]|uniref:SPFH domain-containing protein n=1 Tax=Streptomyces kronopolitis TaxID=1612435 RepID=UPI003698603C